MGKSLNETPRSNFRHLAHFPETGALPADGQTPQKLLKGDGTETPLSMTAGKVFVGGQEVANAVAVAASLAGKASTAQGAKADTALQPSYLTPQTLTSGASIAINGASGIKMRLTLAHNAILATPTGIADGQSFSIAGVQDATGFRSLGASVDYVVRGGTLASIAALGANAPFDVVGERVGTKYRIWITA